MERETKTLVTPLGKQLVLKTYLTTRESRKLREGFIKNTKTTYDERGVPHYEVMDTVGLIDGGEDRAFEAAIVSYDGSTDNIVDRLLDAPKNEFSFVKNAVDEVTSDEDSEEKKTEKAATS